MAQSHSLTEKAAYFLKNLHSFSPSERRLINPHYSKVDISEELRNLKLSILEKLNKEIAEFSID